jgi:hypothetical protein
MTERAQPSDNLLFFNGINGATGDYDLPPQTPAEIASVARGIPLDAAHRQDLNIRRDIDAQSQAHYGLREGLDPKEFSQAGWGVIFPAGLEEEELAPLREALKPLLDHRREQASAQKEHYYKECLGEKGYQAGQSKQDFLAIHGRGPGPADPEKLPYYLLIVGAPEIIPYSFQYQLDVQYAVGRIHFDRLEDYYRYATSVVEAEKRGYNLPRRAAFFGVANEGDRATQLSAENLVQPLADYIAANQPEWTVERSIQAEADKASLSRILHGDQPPALLFTASHGMSFPNGDARQLAHQGALLCQDWPGPQQHKGAIPEDFYFSADDLDSDANVLGSIAFLFACYGAGTPRMDDFYRKAYLERKAIAPHAFLAHLPQQMLAHPHGGALAAVGHVERAWGYSFFWTGVGRELVTFESTLQRLMDGHPIGSALEYFNEKYAEQASDLTSELEETTEEVQNAVKIAGLWTASNDARNYMVIGDPAVRLSVGSSSPSEGQREAILELVSKPYEASAPQQEAPAPTVIVAGAAIAAIPGSEVDEYGVREVIQKVGAGVGGGLQQMVDKLSDFLSKALEDAASLEVKTFISNDIAQVKFEGGTLAGASLRALTYIKIDGDTLNCVPEVDGEVDTELWRIHLDAVQQAQASRAELLKTAVSAVAGIGGLLKPA